jgi:hypothetical protein
MVEFQPIASSTGTFNTPELLGGNRNRSIQTSNNSNPVKRNNNVMTIDLTFTQNNSIIISKEKEKDRYSLNFSVKEISDENKPEEKITIFLRVKKPEQIDEILNSFKKVASLCQAK